MRASRLKSMVLLACVSLMFIFAQSISLAEASILEGGVDNRGPYVDKVRYEFIQNQEDAIIALQNEEVQVIADSIEPQRIEELKEYEEIEIAQTNRNGYGFFLFNCEKYPLNAPVLRRAAALAFDKTSVATEIWRGYAEPLDSPLPRMNPFCAENELERHYYTTDTSGGNALLDEAGFNINETTGYREAPNGEPFDIVIEVPQQSQMQLAIARTLGDAFEDLSIDAKVVVGDLYEIQCRTPEFDIRLLENQFSDFTVSWLASRLWVDGRKCYCPSYTPYQELLEVRNASFRYWKEQLLNGDSYEDVREAAVEIQKIIVYECPMIVAYESKYLSAYRTNRFEEIVKGANQGVNSWWMPYHAQIINPAGDNMGGTLPIAYASEPSTFNPMLLSSSIPNQITQFFYDSLLRQGPDGEDIPWFAKDYTIETHEDNATIPENHTRLTFNMIQNATWTDGTPITAEDAAFTLEYLRDAPGNPLGRNLANLSDAYAVSTHGLIVEFETQSFHILHEVGCKPIFPKHILTEIGLQGWNTWNPNPPEEPMVTSGPFNMTEYERGEYCVLSKNPNYPFSPTSNGGNTSTSNSLVDMGLMITIGITAVVIVLIIGFEFSKS